jgi:hypothetical protein
MAIERSPEQPQFLFFQLAPVMRGGFLGRGPFIGPPGGRGGGGGRGGLAPMNPGGPPQMPEASLPDSIHYTVSKLGGKTIIIRTPGDLAKAIDRLQQTSRNRGGG